MLLLFLIPFKIFEILSSYICALRWLPVVVIMVIIRYVWVELSLIPHFHLGYVLGTYGTQIHWKKKLNKNVRSAF